MPIQFITHAHYEAARARALKIARSLGYRRAAGHLRNKGLTFEAAHFALFGHAPRLG